MGTRQGNKLAPHVAPDHSISDFSLDSISLSFAGLVSIQDHQQPNPSLPNQDQHYHRLNKLPEPDFEFATKKADLDSGANPIRIRPADVLISNGQLIPQALPSQPNRSSFKPNPPRSLRTFLATDHNISSRMPSGQTVTAKKYYEPLGKARNHSNGEKAETRTSFGKKVLSSFLSPCRKCKAIQPGAAKCCKRKSSKYK